MNKIVAVGLIGLVMIGFTGCGTVPKTAITGKTLNAEHVIYFEQSDRVPKDVMIEAIKSQKVTNSGMASIQALPPEIIAAIVKEVLTVIPKVTEGYQNERMNEALVGRRILFRGYNGTNDLKDIDAIIKSMDGCIEKWTQPNK
jgi:uncharacterized protein CbrC (UPF0167 family)